MARRPPRGADQHDRPGGTDGGAGRGRRPARPAGPGRRGDRRRSCHGGRRAAGSTARDGGPAPRRPDARAQPADGGLLDGYDELPPPRLHLCASGPGFCRHEPLEGYDRRTRRLLARIREIGQERDTADGDDLVHLDFHPGNVLVDNGRISGLVDWDGAGRGDGGLDLVTLRFDLALRAPALGAALEERIRADVPADRLRAYWAHMSLRLVDWAIRHHGPGDVDRWVAVARTGLD